MNPNRKTMVLFWLAACAFLLAISVNASAQTKPKIKHIGIEQPKTVLYVGNSFFYFNDSMHRYVSGLVNAADPKNKGQYRSTSITISGAGLNWHDVDLTSSPEGLLPILLWKTTRWSSTNSTSPLKL